jgi:hypothetical protein
MFFFFFATGISMFHFVQNLYLIIKGETFPWFGPSKCASCVRLSAFVRRRTLLALCRGRN